MMSSIRKEFLNQRAELLGKKGMGMPQNSFHFDDLIPNLVSLYQRGTLTPFIGAGMSAGACTDWHTFVARLASKAGLTETAERIEKTPGINPADVIRGADAAVRVLRLLPPEDRAAIYREALRKPVTTGLLSYKEIPANTRALASGLYWPLVISTNYDDLYWTACTDREPGHYERERTVVLGRGREDCHTILRSLDQVYPPVLWTIQGFLGGQAASAERILGPSYRNRLHELEAQVVVGHQHYQQAINSDGHFRRAFAEVFRRRSLLFLGSGILEDYFINLFSEIVYHYGTGYYPHVALLDRAKEGQYDVNFLKVRLGICPVFYDADESHRAVYDALKALRAAARPELYGKVKPQKTIGNLKSRTYALTSGRLDLPLNVILTNSPLPGTVSADQCVAFSVGRIDNLPSLGKAGGSYLKGRGLTNTPESWERLGKESPVFAYRYQNQNIFAIAARGQHQDSGKHQEDYRDLGIIPKAVSTALQEIDRAGYTHVYLSAIASGSAAKHLWHPVHPFVQTLRGIRLFLNDPGRTNVQRVELCLPDTRIWGHILSNRVPVLELLTVDLISFPVELRDTEGKIDTFSLLLRDGASVGDILQEIGLDKAQKEVEWSVQVVPPPTVTRQPDYDHSTILAPTMLVRISPRAKQPSSQG